MLDRDGYKEMMTPAYSLKGNMLIKSETISSSTTESEGVGTYEPIKARPVSKRFIDTFSDEEKANDIRYEMNFTVKRITKKAEPSTCTTDSEKTGVTERCRSW